MQKPGAALLHLLHKGACTAQQNAGVPQPAPRHQTVGFLGALRGTVFHAAARHLAQKAVAGVARAGRHAQTRHFTLHGNGTSLRNGRFIVALDQIVGGNYQKVFLALGQQGRQRQNRRGFVRFLLAEAAIHHPLNGLQLAFHNGAVGRRGEDPEFIAKRHIAHDGFLKQRMAVFQIDKLLGIIFAGQRPKAVSRTACQHDTFHTIAFLLHRFTAAARLQPRQAQR